MAIDREMVERIALLARLEIGEEEREIFAEQLGTILEYANRLNQLKTEDVEPLAHVLPLHNVFREDRVEPSMPRERILGEEDYFHVPRIIDESSI